MKVFELEGGSQKRPGDLHEVFHILTPNEDPSVAADCQKTFQNDTYRFRFWASRTATSHRLLEIGANVGCWSLYAAKVMGMKVWALEPNKSLGGRTVLLAEGRLKIEKRH